MSRDSHRPILILALLLGAGAAAAGEAPSLDQLDLEQLLKVRVDVASQGESTLLDAPAVVSVITADEIRRSGARDLRDVLRTVPGFEPGVRMIGYPQIGVRGVLTDNSEKVRILLDGLPVNENLEGSGTIVFGDFALENVERIEIIRGPGSALYGTNAFVAVISIRTKGPPAAGWANAVSLRGGSFGTFEGSVRTGWAGQKLSAALFAHWLDTQGPASPVAVDGLRAAPGNPFYSDLNAGISLAGTWRGHTSEFRRKLTTQLKVEYGEVAFNGVFVDARKGGYLSPYWAVNERSEAHPYQFQGTLEATFRPGADWTIEPRLYLLHYRADNLWNAPEGYSAPDGQGGVTTWTAGRFDRNDATQETRGAEVRANWTPHPAHRLTAGLGFEQQALFRLVQTVNVPGEGPERTVDAPPLMPNVTRGVLSAYLQEQWTALPTLVLTGGLRLDRFDDAGTSLVPRIAAVWRPAPPLTLKLLYGEAFRAPTFVESYLYAVGGFLRGRADNRPETLRTAEVEACVRFGDLALARVAGFYTRIANLLRFVPVDGHLEYQNTPGTAVVAGLEAEVKLTLSRAVAAAFNVSGERSEDQATGQPLAGTSSKRGSASLDLTPLPGLTLHLEGVAVGPRARTPGDARPELGGYLVTNVAVTWAPTAELELAATAHNLFGADQRFADVNGPLPGDFPQEGRNLQLGLRSRF